MRHGLHYFLVLLFCLLQTAIVILFAQPLKVSVGNYKIDGHLKNDSSMQMLVKTYKDSMQKCLQEVIGFSVSGLYKKQPEGSLGNFITDAMRLMAEKKFNKQVDAAFLNSGGIRNYIPKGEVTIGKIFEVLAYDNLLLLQDISADSLQSFLNVIASKNGWPISGIQFTIQNKMATNIMVNSKPFDSTKTYTIANADFIVNGGDNITVLKKIKQLNAGYLIRDAVIDYIKHLTDLGKPIDTKIEKRIVFYHE